MEAVYKTIFQKSFAGYILADAQNGECHKINAAAMESLGIMMTEKIDRKFHLSEFFANVKRDGVTNFSEKLLSKEGFHHEIAMKKIDGSIFYAEMGIRKISDKKEYVLVMFHDVTLQLKLRRDLSNKQDEIRRAYDEILAQNKELRALDKTKDKFIALTSHELRTPLSAIVATAEALEMKLYDTEEQLREFIHSIFDQGKYLLSIVNDILDFSKIQAGKLDLYLWQQNPHNLVQDKVKLFENFAKEKGVHIEVDQKKADLECYYDDVRLHQVISNILSNAIKFTHANTKIIIQLNADEEYTLISIQDEGPGIAKENHQKIFDEFETLQNIDTHHKGTGLGLPISRRLMELQGGGIDLISELGKGATFIIKVPKSKLMDESLYRKRPSDEDDLAA